MKHLSLCLLALLFLFTGHGYAQQITLVTRQDILPFKSFTDGFIRAQSLDTDHSAAKITVLDITGNSENITALIKDYAPDIIVCVGKASLSFIPPDDTATRTVFSMALPPFDDPVFHRPNLTGISMNVRTEEKLHILKRIYPGIKNIGAVYDPSQSEAEVNESIAYAQQQGFSLNAVPVTTPPMAIRAIGDIIPKSDIFLLFVDRTALTSTAIEYIFSRSFRDNVPVIGLSEKYTRLGALFSLEVPPEELGRQAWELCHEYLRGNKIDDGIINPSGPFKLSVNNTAAEKMGIKIPRDILDKAYIVY